MKFLTIFCCYNELTTILPSNDILTLDYKPGHWALCYFYIVQYSLLMSVMFFYCIAVACKAHRNWELDFFPGPLGDRQLMIPTDPVYI